MFHYLYSLIYSFERIYRIKDEEKSSALDKRATKKQKASGKIVRVCSAEEASGEHTEENRPTPGRSGGERERASIEFQMLLERSRPTDTKEWRRRTPYVEHFRAIQASHNRPNAFFPLLAWHVQLIDAATERVKSAFSILFRSEFTPIIRYFIIISKNSIYSCTLVSKSSPMGGHWTPPCKYEYFAAKANKVRSEFRIGG